MVVSLNIYIIHSSKLSNREGNINRLRTLAKDVTNMEVTINVINEHEPDTINVNNIKNLVKIDKLPEEENQFYKPFVKQMSLEILSNTFNHFKAIQTISKNSKDSYNLILEDDVMYSDKIYSQLSSLIARLATTEMWDVVFLGQPSDGTVNTDNNNLVFNNMDTHDLLLHCCESYILNVDTAKDIVINFFPIRFGYNIQLSYILNKYSYKCLKIFPNICGDGSKMGNYTSSILMNNVLLFNNLYKEIYLMLENNPVLSEELKTRIESKFAENTKYTNPDFMYLEGLYYKRIGKFDKCKDIFEKAMAKYEEDNTPMNNTSTFLRNYIELFKVL